MNTRRKIIASRIREARLLAGLSQAQVAKILKLHRPSVSEMEAGNRAVSAEEITSLAELLDVNPTWLMGTETDQLDPLADKIQLAARELHKLRPEDLQRLLKILARIRTGEIEDQL
jgi:transcriptional regulator with XRE-family HTH domain